ncbi:MAG: vWA domain-containing protein [Armatimonadia bacterium]
MAEESVTVRWRLCAAACLAVLIVALCGLGGCTAPPARSEITLKLPEPSPPLVDVALLLDQSGSMNGPQGTDPQGVRVEAARYLIANISEKSAEDQPNRIAVLDFGDRVSPETAPLTAVTPSSGFQEVSARVAAKGMGGTNTLAALKAATGSLRSAGGFDEGRKCRIVLFTDGKPEDSRKLSTSAYFDEISAFVQKELVPNGCELYVIAVDQQGDTWAECAELWSAIAGSERVACIKSVSELRERFNQVINRIFGIPNVPPDILTAGRKTFTVRPYLDRVEFHVFPATPELRLRILRPDGTALSPGADPDTRRRQFKGYDIISVFDPETGQWQYEITEGTGRVEVYRNEVPLQMNLVLPKTVHPQGKSLRVVASFARHSGKPVESDARYPLGLSAQVLGPTGGPVNLEFGKPARSLYYGEPAIPTKLPGVYKLTLRVQAGSVLDATTTYNVKVASVPYLELTPVTLTGFPFTQQFLAVDGTLMLSGKPAQPEKQFSNHPNHLYLAQLSEMPDGKDSPVLWLKANGNRFSTRFAVPMRTRLFIQQPVPGDCVLHVEHTGTPAGDVESTCHDTSMQVVHIRATGWSTPLRVLILLALLYVALIALSWAWLLCRLLGARRMSMDIRITHAGTGQALATFRNAGKRVAWVRTTPWKDPTPAKGKRALRVRPRRFAFWGIDRAGVQVGCARFVWGLAVPSRLRKGQATAIGLIRVRS